MSLKNDGGIDVLTRRNAIDIAARALLIGASVAITAVLVSIGVMQLGRAKSLASVVTQEMLELETRISESDVMRYDGVKVTGSDVKNFCRRYLGYCENANDAEFTVTVSDAQGVRNGADRYFADRLCDDGDRYYVRPGATYKCRVVRNENNVITEVCFE